MIPKKIHYCWFGGNPLPDEYKKNIETWKKFNPEYKIIQWDESNYDVHKIKYLDEAYKEKKWAFVSDYARLDIVYNHGGIYLDTDVEVLKSFDDLLNNDAFMGVEIGNNINSGLGFGAIKHNEAIKLNKEKYENISIYDNNGNIKLINCPKITTDLFKEYGAKLDGKIEKILDITIYPEEYFCPMDYYTGEINVTKNTYSIHKYSMSWWGYWDKKQLKVERKISKVLGKKITKIILKIMFFPFKFFERLKNYGLKKTIKHYLKK